MEETGLEMGNLGLLRFGEASAHNNLSQGLGTEMKTVQSWKRRSFLALGSLGCREGI